MQPFDISKIPSFAFTTSSWSMGISPNSFSIIANFLAEFSVINLFKRVVFPAPKNPVMMVTGILLLFVMGMFFGRNRVVTAASPWLTATKTFKSQYQSLPGSMDFKRFHHVLRAGRSVSACSRKQGGNGRLIKSDQSY